MKLTKWLVIGGLILVAAAGCRKHLDPVEQAELDMRQNKPIDAIKRIEEAPPEIRDTYKGQFVLGKAYLATKDYDKAVECLKAAQKYDPNQAPPFLKLAEVLQQKALAASDSERASLLAEAISLCNQGLKLDPNLADGYSVLASVQGMRGDMTEALDSLKRAVELDPNTAKRQVTLAEFYYTIGQTPDALKTVDEAIACAERGNDKQAEIDARLLKANLIGLTDREQGKELKKALFAMAGVPVEKQALILQSLTEDDFRATPINVDEIKEYLEQMKKYSALAQYRNIVLSRLAMEAGDWKGVGDSLTTLENSNIPEVLSKLARTAAETGDIDGAITRYEAIIQKAKDGDVPGQYAVEAHAQLAILLTKKGQFDKAMPHCEAALEEVPSNTVLLRLKASILQNPGPYYNPPLAALLYRKVREYDGDSIPLRQAECGLAILNKRYDEALKDVAAIEKMMANLNDTEKQDYAGLPAEMTAQIWQAQAFAEPRGSAKWDKYWAEAISNWQTAIQQKKDPTFAVHLLASVYANLNRNDDAVRFLETYLQAHPKAGIIANDLSLLYERAKNYDRSIAVLQQAKANGADNFDPNWIGRAFFIAGNYKQAIETWRQVLGDGSRTRRDPSASFGLAVALAMDKQNSEAVSQVETALTQMPPSPRNVLLGACIAVQCGNLTRAKEFLGRAVYTSPRQRECYAQFIDLCSSSGEAGNKAASFIGVAFIHEACDDLDTAMDISRQVIDLLPDSVVPYTFAANLFMQYGKTDQGMEMYDRIQKKFPTEGFPLLDLAVGERNTGVPWTRVKEHLELATAFDPELAPAHQLLSDEQAINNAKTPSEIERVVEHALAAERLRNSPDTILNAALAELRLAQSYNDQAAMEQDLTMQQQLGQRYQRAMQEFDNRVSILRRQPDPPLRVTKLIIQYDLEHSNYDNAITAAQNCLKSPRTTDADVFLFLIRGFRSRNNPEDIGQAFRYVNEMLRRYPGDVRGIIVLAQIHQAKFEYEQAEAAFQRAVTQTESNLQLLMPYINFEVSRRDFKRALAICQDVLKSKPCIGDSAEARGIRWMMAVRLASILIMAPPDAIDQRDALLTTAAAVLSEFADPPAGRKPDLLSIMTMGQIREEQRRKDEALALYAKAIEIDPKSVSPWVATALLYVWDGNADKAIETLNKGATAVPSENQACFRFLALIHLIRDQASDADRASEYLGHIRGFESSIGVTGVSQISEANLLVLIAQRKYSDAQIEVKRLETRDPGMRKAMSLLIDSCQQNDSRRHALVSGMARVLLARQTRNSNEAIRSLTALLKVFPKNLTLLDRLSSIQLAGNDLPGYADTMEQMISAAEGDPAILGQMQPEYHRKMYDAMIEMRQRAAGGSVVERTKEQPRLIAMCKKAVERWPDYPHFHYALSTVCLWNSATHDQGVSELQQAIKLSQAQGNAKLAIMYKKVLCQTYIALKEFPKALALAEELDPVSQDDPDMLNNSAWLHAVYGSGRADLRKAVDLAEQAKTLNPTDGNLRDTLGWIYALSNRYFDAIEELQYASKEVTTDPAVFYHLGYVQIKLQKKEEGIASLKKALDLQKRGVPFLNAKECQELLAEQGVK